MKLSLMRERVDPGCLNNCVIKIAAENDHSKIVHALLGDQRVISKARLCELIKSNPNFFDSFNEDQLFDGLELSPSNSPTFKVLPYDNKENMACPLYSFQNENKIDPKSDEDELESQSTGCQIDVSNKLENAVIVTEESRMSDLTLSNIDSPSYTYSIAKSAKSFKKRDQLVMHLGRLYSKK